MSELIGYFLAIDAIITWSLASLVYKKGLGKTEAKATLFFRIMCVTFFTFMISLIFGKYPFIMKLREWDKFNYLFMCILSGVFVSIGDLLYFTSLQKIDVSRAFPLTQLSLVFVYPFAFFFFREELTTQILIGGCLILMSVFFLSSKDKIEDQEDTPEKQKEELILGVALGIGTALFWALSMITFHQARIISNDVFVTNFIRCFFGMMLFAIIGIFQRDYFAAFKKENRYIMKYYFYIGLAGSLSLGLADSLFYKAAEINGLILTSTITANTPMVQQIFSVLILKEKFRKKFILAVLLIILGNYLILFL
ncbi:MAG: GRP family sugar transporter [Promethearchaeota archaeon]